MSANNNSRSQPLSFEETLINAVFLRQFLYDKSNPAHKRRNKINQAWDEIACEVDKPVEVCKSMWRNLKDRFLKLAKEKQNVNNDSSQIDDPITWRHFNQLKFLSKFILPKLTKNSLENTENRQPSINVLQVVGKTTETPVLRPVSNVIPSLTSSSRSSTGEIDLSRSNVTVSIPVRLENLNSSNQLPQTVKRKNNIIDALKKIGNLIHTQIQYNNFMMQKKGLIIFLQN